MKHGNALRRGLALVLSAAMAVSSAFAVDWNVSKSKTAADLDENWESKVSISLPSAEVEPITDVVFVLDRSSSAGKARQEISEMMDNLLEIVETSDAKINIGVVNFWYKADSGISLTSLSKESITEIKNAIMEENVSGTNIEAGIKAAKKMLDKSSTPDENKYMVLVTDGISHAWNSPDNDNTVMTIWGEGVADSTVIFNGANSYYYFDDSKTNFEGIYETSASDPQLDDQYDIPVFNENGSVIDESDFKSTPYYEENKYIPKDGYDSHFSGVEKGVYTAAHAFDDVASQYKCITLYWENSSYPVSTQFMEWAASKSVASFDITNGSDVSAAFDSVEREICYLLDAGSTVTDYIGQGEDSEGNKYDFDFVNDLTKISIKVGDRILQAELVSDTAEKTVYKFGEITDDSVNEYMLTYYKENSEGSERFVWEINVPVSNFEPVQLTYSVVLTNPQTTEGTYQRLLTNVDAILEPVSTDGTEGELEYFTRPELSYVVTDSGVEPGPDPEPTPGGDDDDKPSGGSGDNDDRYEGADLTVVKVDEDGETIEANARFRIYKEQGKKTMWYKGNQSWSEDEEDAWIFNTSVGDSSFTAYDLKPGTYYIVEISAPEGYDLAEEPLEVEVESRDVTVEFVNSGDGVVTTPTKPVPDTGR